MSEQADDVQCESRDRCFKKTEIPQEAQVCLPEAGQWKNREALSSAHCATDGLGLLAALVCTGMQQKAETRSFHRKDT